MSTPQQTVGLLEKLKCLCACHGFVYSTADIPGRVLPGSYVYGPLGTELRRNLKTEWWRSVVTSHGIIFGVHSPQVLFSDECENNAMKIMDPFSDTGHDGNSQQQNVYLQPSCEKGILYNYPAVLKLLNQKLPFGLAEIARCFRKNIHDNSDKFLFNLPEFTQMSMQFYSPPSVATKWMNVWQRERIIWWRKFAGYPSKFHLTDIKMTETQQTVDIQYEFPWGVDTVERITNRGDVDLVELERQSGINMQGRYGRKVVTPVVIETTAGLDRGMLAYLLDAYQEKERSDTRGKLKERKILRLHMKITPIKVVVHPIKNTRELREISEHLAKELRLSGVNTLYVCDAMTLDQHLVRFDEMGVPFTVIINEGTLKTGVIGMRSRDTALREQMHITEVKTLLLEHLKKE